MRLALLLACLLVLPLTTAYTFTLIGDDSFLDSQGANLNSGNACRLNVFDQYGGEQVLTENIGYPDRWQYWSVNPTTGAGCFGNTNVYDVGAARINFNLYDGAVGTIGRMPAFTSVVRYGTLFNQKTGWVFDGIETTKVNNFGATTTQSVYSSSGTLTRNVLKIGTVAWCGEQITLDFTKSTISPSGIYLRGASEFVDCDWSAGSTMLDYYETLAAPGSTDSTNNNQDIWMYYSTQLQRNQPFSLPLQQSCAAYAVRVTGRTQTDWYYSSARIEEAAKSSYNYVWEKQTGSGNHIQVNMYTSPVNRKLTKINVQSEDYSSQTGGLMFEVYCVEPYICDYDGALEPGESLTYCGDAPCVLDGVCQTWESYPSCQDTACLPAGSCGNGVCDPAPQSEDAVSCPEDCGFEAFCPTGQLLDPASGLCYNPTCGNPGTRGTICPDGGTSLAGWYCSNGDSGELPGSGYCCRAGERYDPNLFGPGVGGCGGTEQCYSSDCPYLPTDARYYTEPLCVSSSANYGSPGACCSVGTKYGTSPYYDYKNATGGDQNNFKIY
jgi:hypothetical protein